MQTTDIGCHCFYCKIFYANLCYGRNAAIQIRMQDTLKTLTTLLIKKRKKKKKKKKKKKTKKKKLTRRCC